MQYNRIGYNDNDNNDINITDTTSDNIRKFNEYNDNIDSIFITTVNNNKSINTER